ncbi:uncharacterized protein LOC142333286 [Lycorma delicatula]|uniref:uncharacterized protein LOC142333286 n=1 Tax=Lycorma delicatula TaxID=130591 RepID=UPI003F514650
MTNFKLYYLFYKTKSKEMLIILLDYFDVKNIFDITNNLPSIITAAIMHDMDIKIIRRLIDRGGSINDIDVRGVSPLFQSIKSKRNVNFVKEILEMGANINEICYDGNSILDAAVSNFCSGDDIEVIKLLMVKAARNLYCEFPLRTLPLNVDEDLWLELVKGRLHISRYTINTTLHDTFLTNVVSKTSRIKQFIDVLNYNQFEIDTMNKICNRLLYVALNNNCCADCITEIINNGANINEMKYLNFVVNDKALLIALKLNRDKEIILALLDNGADINVIDEFEWTPLSYAIKKIIQLK